MCFYIYYNGLFFMKSLVKVLDDELVLKKYLINITIIIFVNLFAFLAIWHILDTIFWTGGRFKLILVFVSVVSFTVIMFFYWKKIFKELNKIQKCKKKNK